MCSPNPNPLISCLSSEFRIPGVEFFESKTWLLSSSHTFYHIKLPHLRIIVSPLSSFTPKYDDVMITEMLVTMMGEFSLAEWCIFQVVDSAVCHHALPLFPYLNECSFILMNLLRLQNLQLSYVCSKATSFWTAISCPHGSLSILDFCSSHRLTFCNLCLDLISFIHQNELNNEI